MRCILVGAFLALSTLGVILLMSGRAHAKVVEGGPTPLMETASLADRIKPGKTLHIVFVHGMRAEGPGASAEVANLLKSKLGFEPAGAAPDHVIDIGRWPESAEFVDQPIWRNRAEWEASRPFVRRATFLRSDRARIVIDEVNWWPLLFPLKCRLLIAPENELSGNDVEHIALCRRNDRTNHYYQWLSDADLAALDRRPKGGHASLANRFLKQQIMNWGLSDAVIALGPMRSYLKQAMDDAFDFARQGAEGDRFVVMAESLGSFAVLDAMILNGSAVRDVFARTDDLYLFANQFALLELGRIDGLPQASTFPQPSLAADAGSTSSDRVSPLTTLREWGMVSRHERDLASGQAERPRQIIAFSDPNDLFTYLMPPIPGVKVVNLFDRNATSWLGLFENPVAAHTGHLRNRQVIKLLVEIRQP